MSISHTLSIFACHRMLELETTAEIIQLNSTILEMKRANLKDAHLQLTAVSYVVVFSNNLDHNKVVIVINFIDDINQKNIFMMDDKIKIHKVLDRTDRPSRGSCLTKINLNECI